MTTAPNPTLAKYAQLRQRADESRAARRAAFDAYLDAGRLCFNARMDRARVDEVAALSEAEAERARPLTRGERWVRGEMAERNRREADHDALAGGRQPGP